MKSNYQKCVQAIKGRQEGIGCCIDSANKCRFIRAVHSEIFARVYLNPPVINLMIVPRQCFFATYVSCLYLPCFLVCSLQPCGHLLGKGKPLGSLVCDVLLYFVTFPCGVLGLVWHLIVSIPDLCLLTYFVMLSCMFLAAWERADLLALLCVVLSCFFCHFSIWCPLSGMVFD